MRLSNLLQYQAPNPEQFLLGKERIARIDQAIRSLPKRQETGACGFALQEVEVVERENIFREAVKKKRLKLLYG